MKAADAKKGMRVKLNALGVAKASRNYRASIAARTGTVVIDPTPNMRWSGLIEIHRDGTRRNSSKRMQAAYWDIDPR